MKRKTDANIQKNLPSRETIAGKIKELRVQAGLSQSDIAVKLKRTRSWVFQIELGKIDPVYFYGPFVYLYGRQKAVETYGIDWDIYRSDRVKLYYAYYKVNRAISCEKMGCTYTALLHMLNAPGKYITSYKKGIDKVFPKMKKEQEKLSHYHIVGNNSMVFISGSIPYIYLNVASSRTLDDPTDCEKLNEDVNYWLKWHRTHDGKPEDGIIDLSRH